MFLRGGGVGTFDCYVKRTTLTILIEQHHKNYIWFQYSLVILVVLFS